MPRDPLSFQQLAAGKAAGGKNALNMSKSGCISTSPSQPAPPWRIPVCYIDTAA